jgi:hypothetical protein
MNNDKILLEQLIEYEIKEYDAKILNEQLLKNIGNAIKSFFQKIASFLGGIGKNVKAGHDLFVKDWSETQKKMPKFFEVVVKNTKVKDFNDILNNSKNAIEEYLDENPELGGIAADTLISIFKNDFSFFEKQAERIEEAPSQQAIQQLLLNYEDLFDAYEEFTMSFKEDFDYVENKLKKFDLERVINLLLQLHQDQDGQKKDTKPTGPVSREIDNVLSEPS